MYNLAEDYWLEPRDKEILGYCVECGQNIYAGEEIWEIKGEWFCEYCIDHSRKEAERDEYFENVV